MSNRDLTERVKALEAQVELASRAISCLNRLLADKRVVTRRELLDAFVAEDKRKGKPPVILCKGNKR